MRSRPRGETRRAVGDASRCTGTGTPHRSSPRATADTPAATSCAPSPKTDVCTWRHVHVCARISAHVYTPVCSSLCAHTHVYTCRCTYHLLLLNPFTSTPKHVCDLPPHTGRTPTWAAAALHVLQVLDQLLGFHLVPPPVGDPRPQLLVPVHGTLVLIRQEDLLAPRPQLAQRRHFLRGRVIGDLTELGGDIGVSEDSGGICVRVVPSILSQGHRHSPVTAAWPHAVSDRDKRVSRSQHFT